MSCHDASRRVALQLDSADYTLRDPSSHSQHCYELITSTDAFQK